MRVFSDPKKIIEELGISAGVQVVDFGAGSGFYALASAKIVGDQGRVYAVDIQKDLLTKIKKEARDENLNNLEVVWGDLENIGGSKIKDSLVDFCLVTNILFQIEEKENFARECWRVLKPGGKLLVVDWTDSFGGLGPESARVFPAEKVKELFVGKGFKHLRDIPAGAHHYGMIFIKN